LASRASSLAKLKDRGTANSEKMTANDRSVHFMADLSFRDVADYSGAADGKLRS